jgi:addiction module HigA family antidote
MTEDGKPLHPGRILLVQAMEPLGISRNQLARDIDVPVGRISDITNGKRGITADTALRLGRYFGTGPELWLRLQAEYDLHVARITTWPAVESRVRTLETAEIDGPASGSATPPASEPATNTTVAGNIDLDDEAADAEIYALPGDVEAQNAASVWAPAALPVEESETPDRAPTLDPAGDEPAADPAESINPEPVPAIQETVADAVTTETENEEDIGIPPAPGGAGSTVPR